MPRERVVIAIIGYYVYNRLYIIYIIGDYILAWKDRLHWKEYLKGENSGQRKEYIQKYWNRRVPGIEDSKVASVTGVE